MPGLCGPSSRRGAIAGSRALHWAASILSILILGLGFLPATTLRTLNLEEMTRKAGRIVVGRCVSVEELRHPKLGIPIAKVTLRLDRTLKGRGKKTLTFQTPVSGSVDSGSPGVPPFKVGEKLILFLYPESRSGLTSPVGLGQGKFLRGPDKDGKEIALNGFGNRSLLTDLSPQGARKLGLDKAKGHEDRAPRLTSEVLIRMVEELAP